MYYKVRIRVAPVILLCAVFSIIISGCSKASLDASSSSTTLTWDAPGNYTNGDGLPYTDIAKYKIYYSTSHITQPTVSFYPVLLDPNSTATQISVNVKDIISQPTGTFFFVVTAVDKNGVESDFSNEVSREIK